MLSGIEDFQAGAATHVAVGNRQMLLLDSKASAAMRALSDVGFSHYGDLIWSC
jgi:predicted GNAT family acetyltransferase